MTSEYLLGLETRIQVTVCQARELASKSRSGLSDAFCVIALNKEKFQTQVVEKSSTPVWNEACEWTVSGNSSKDKNIDINIYSRSYFGLDDFLGFVSIPFNDEIEISNIPQTRWYTLSGKAGKQDAKYRGQVEVTLLSTRTNKQISPSDNNTTTTTTDDLRKQRSISLKNVASSVGSKMKLARSRSFRDKKHRKDNSNKMHTSQKQLLYQQQQLDMDEDSLLGDDDDDQSQPPSLPGSRRSSTECTPLGNSSSSNDFQSLDSSPRSAHRLHYLSNRKNNERFINKTDPRSTSLDSPTPVPSVPPNFSKTVSQPYLQTQSSKSMNHAISISAISSNSRKGMGNSSNPHTARGNGVTPPPTLGETNEVQVNGCHENGPPDSMNIAQRVLLRSKQSLTSREKREKLLHRHSVHGTLLRTKSTDPFDEGGVRATTHTTNGSLSNPVTPTDIEQPAITHHRGNGHTFRPFWKIRTPEIFTAEFEPMSKEDLVKVAATQQAQLKDKERQIRELENYIDNLLVRVMENTPNILKAPENHRIY